VPGRRPGAAIFSGSLVATSFLLAYFDFFSIRGARTARNARGPRRVARLRDVYSYTHLPRIVGIVLFSFAMRVLVVTSGRTSTPLRRSPSAAEAPSLLLTYSSFSVADRRTPPPGCPLALAVAGSSVCAHFAMVFPLATPCRGAGPGPRSHWSCEVWLALHTTSSSGGSRLVQSLARCSPRPRRLGRNRSASRLSGRLSSGDGDSGCRGRGQGTRCWSPRRGRSPAVWPRPAFASSHRPKVQSAGNWSGAAGAKPAASSHSNKPHRR